jgi:hypothetical protein
MADAEALSKGLTSSSEVVRLDVAVSQIFDCGRLTAQQSPLHRRRHGNAVANWVCISHGVACLLMVLRPIIDRYLLDRELRQLTRRFFPNGKAIPFLCQRIRGQS